ncbi:TetR/AcrR family transcriptional regulator [Nocardia arizonensis]|uniref:TetR/AcrR family transcriptional regulator n=1 Tax=Nocardia arizonensis TaxID=1141647 RepID=UPI0006D057FD|nr:TetR/AcrR family transcriptional regulator [Nocardia arizonensis]
MTAGFDGPEDAILDAALERFLRVGIRQSSMDDIARDSGIDRPSLHDRFSAKEGLIEALLVRETRRMLAEATAIATTTHDVDEQIEKTMLHVLDQTRMHRLVTQLLHVVPEESLTYFTVRGQQRVTLGIDYIAGMLCHAQELGLIDRYDPRPVAELIARLAHSLLLTPSGGVDFTDSERMRLFIRTAIVPLVKHGLGPHKPRNTPGGNCTPPTRPR